MASGGYRPGAGRKKGSGRKGTSEEARQIREMLALKTKAKVKLFNDLLVKIKNGQTITITEKKLMDILSVELAAEVNEEAPKIETGEIRTPLEYMLAVMNDPKEDKELRARMAVSAAPYIHPRQGGGMGKKDEKAERAKAAGAGKFQAGRPPLAVVK